MSVAIFNFQFPPLPKFLFPQGTGGVCRTGILSIHINRICITTIPLHSISTVILLLWDGLSFSMRRCSLTELFHQSGMNPVSLLLQPMAAQQEGGSKDFLAVPKFLSSFGGTQKLFFLCTVLVPHNKQLANFAEWSLLHFHPPNIRKEKQHTQVIDHRRRIRFLSLSKSSLGRREALLKRTTLLPEI